MLTDWDSVRKKPVSSLRSHFESMASSNLPTSAPTFQRLVAIPSHVEPERGRSSVDIPRRGSPWNVTNEEQSNSREKNPKAFGGPLPRATGTGGPLRQRPLSMGPLSPPQTPPVVNIQSPRSPVKPTNFSSESSSTSATPNTSSKSSYPSAVSPARTPNRSPKPRVVVQLPSVPSTHQTGSTQTKSSQNSKAKYSSMPPPVNRADKPKLFSKSSMSTNQTEWQSLEPAESKTVNRISPFSTPPSSNEGSPDVEFSSGKSTISMQGAKIVPRLRTDEYFPPPPTHHSIEPRRELRHRPIVQSSRPRGARENGFAPAKILPGTLVGSRQNLSVRPEANRSATDLSSKTDTIQRPQPYRAATVRQPGNSPITRSTTDFLPPPKRNVIPAHQDSLPRRASPGVQTTSSVPSRTPSDLSNPAHTRIASWKVDSSEPEVVEVEPEGSVGLSADYPDASQSNRRVPRTHSGTQQIDTKYETRVFDICGHHVCTTGYLTKAWDITTGRMVTEISHGDREYKITAIAFKPGASPDDEGACIWLGSNHGDMQEIDLVSQSVTQTRPQAHSRREVVKIYRHQNSMWSLDDDGKLQVWPPDVQGLPSLQSNPISQRVTKGHTFSIVIGIHLWLATGKEIRIYEPGAIGDASFQVGQQAFSQPNTGEITSGAVISNQLNQVYFGHTDGKVSVYSTTDFACKCVINVSVYKINTLAGAGRYLWAGYNTGMIYVYDTSTQPWQIRKEWLAHDSPVLNILVDRSSIWKLGDLHVASIGSDNAVKMWDGILEDDWLGEKLATEKVERSMLTCCRK